MKRILLIVASIFAILLLIGVLIAFQFNLSAIPEPGRMETLFATQGKRFIIRRASLAVIAPAPPYKQASIKEGYKLFGTDCSACHGYSGRKPTDAGRWMYPRAAYLGSADVQRYSERELFWIVKNGIRLSGMPAFGKVESDQQIWNLVHFVRTLPANPNPNGEGARH